MYVLIVIGIIWIVSALYRYDRHLENQYFMTYCDETTFLSDYDTVSPFNESELKVTVIFLSPSTNSSITTQIIHDRASWMGSRGMENTMVANVGNRIINYTFYSPQHAAEFKDTWYNDSVNDLC